MFFLISGRNIIEAESSKARNGKASLRAQFSSRYYNQSFGLCKLSRKMNTVEQVRAQAFATRVFARCGSKTIVRWGSELKMPAFGKSVSEHRSASRF